jgi:hypothetical protein
MRSGGCIYFRGRKRKIADGPEWVPETFWTRFGEDTAIVDTNYEPPQITTWADIGHQKRQRQAERLAYKRTSPYSENVRPIYVWVFHVPGFIYGGWWTYLIGRGGWTSGKYLDRDGKTIRQLMDLFPFGDQTLYGRDLTHEQWQIRFAKAFCCRNSHGVPRKRGGRIQGKAPLWAEFHGCCVERIIGRAYLPKDKS